MTKMNGNKKDEAVAVAIESGKASQYALKWAVDHVLKRGQSVTLLHIEPKTTTIPTPSGPVSMTDFNDDMAKAYNDQQETQSTKLFLSFRCFCTRKDIQCNEVIVEDADVPKGIVDFVSKSSIEILVLGAPSKSGLFRRFKVGSDVPNKVLASIPDFCTVYSISKGKIIATKSASRPLPSIAQTQSQLFKQPSKNSLSSGTQLCNYQKPKGAERTQNMSQTGLDTVRLDTHISADRIPFDTQRATRRTPSIALSPPDEMEFRSPFDRPSCNRSYEPAMPNSDISFVSSGRPSIDLMFPSFYDNPEPGTNPGMLNSSDMDTNSFLSSSATKSIDMSQYEFSSSSSQNMDDVEAEMRRLKQELKQTMDMYSSACKEALAAKESANELQQWKWEEQQKLGETLHSEEAAVSLEEKEKAKYKAAIEAAEAAKRIANLETQKRANFEKKEEKKPSNSLACNDVRYRRYSIEDIEIATEYFADSLKIGEGGYGPVYKCYLDHTPVAIKVLRPDAAQGRSQFNQEVEVLSCIRHPNMVLLLGACPEYGCLVYEHMANGSLDDCLFGRGNTPVLSWQVRFRIAAEISTALLFLHQAKPEPIVHRDLKPGNILLDRNYVSKISDVGLARLVPPSVANSVTQYRMTSTAGTFCYIDPEYQQTGMLGTKSDIYSLGIMLLQIITSKPPMGLTHHVERSIENGTFSEMLDPAVPDWPVQEALKFAKLALQCAELRRKDRPDLGKVVLPLLNRLRDLAEDNMPNFMFCGNYGPSTTNTHGFTNQDVFSDHGYESSKSRSNASNSAGRI